ncbi:MAG: SDR family oxidoreductase [Pseudomonadota bacterium]
MSDMYKNRWALITGASSGIGAAFAQALIKQGAHVVLVARREEKLNQIAQDARAAGVNAMVIPADLADPASPVMIMDQLTHENIDIDILINNAGFGLPGGYAETSWADQSYFLQLMVTSYAELAHRIFPTMLEKGWGRIINVASLAGLIPGASGHTLYGASKSFLISFSQSLAAEAYHKPGVKISAFCPGFTLTEFHDRNHTRAQINALPSFMVMEADKAVTGALKALEDQNTVYVPGGWNKFLAFLARSLPLSLAETLVRAQSAKFRRTQPLSSDESSSSGRTTIT